MGRRARKQPKPKFLKFTVVTREEDHKLYNKLDAIIERSHKTQLGDAHIALAYAEDVKPDKEQELMLWQVRLPSKVEKQLHGFDLILILNGNYWRSSSKTHEAIFDEACCSIVPDVDKDGNRKYDAKDKPLYHLRKPPIRCFRENIRRFGFWKATVEEFVKETASKLPTPEPTLFEPKPAPRPGPELTSADVANAIEAEAAVVVGLGTVYGGFKRTGRSKSEQGVAMDEAKELIDRVQQFRDAKNTGAAMATTRRLKDAGWTELEEARAVDVGAKVPAQAVA